MELFWITSAFFVGGTVGFFMAALMAMAARASRDEEAAERQRHG